MCQKLKIYQKENPKENKVLRNISKNVEISEIKSEKIKKIISNMNYFIEVQPDGVALAAPQIGENVRVFVVSAHVFEVLDKKIESPADLVFINPKIIKKSKKTKMMDEGCFSVRWIYGQVKRSTNITISATNADGVEKTWGAGGLLAHIFQHEIEHLDGILFCDKAINLEKMNDERIAEITKERKEMEKNRKNKK